MTSVVLLEPVPTSQWISLRFFNGRLLTGGDLTREQQAIYGRDRDLGFAIGSGVLTGLEVASSGELKLQVTAGKGINPSGELLRLTGEVTLVLQTAPQPPGPPRADWRRCATAKQTDEPKAQAGLFLLTMVPSPVDSAAHARVLQVDRANDDCTVDRLEAAVCFRLVRMSDLEAKLAGASADRLRNQAAHECYGTALVPDALRFDSSARAVQALATKNDLANDVPLALLRLDATNKIVWVDAWAVRRRPVPALPHAEWERLTGPRAIAEAEARLLQFQEQVTPMPAPTAPAADLGRCVDAFAFLPPAGELPLTWLDDGSWRHFFGPFMAPLHHVACDSRLLASKLANAALARAIPTEFSVDATTKLAVDSAPAVDVYRGLRDGGGNAQALVFVQSEQSRVRIALTGDAMTDVIAAEVMVRITANGGNATFVAEREANTRRWFSPNLPAGEYRVTLESVRVAADPAAVVLVAGRVHAATLAVTSIVGVLVVRVVGVKASRVLRVLAKHGNDEQEVRIDDNGVGRVSPAAIGAWSVRAEVDRIGVRSVTVEVQANATAEAVLVFEEKPVRPERWVIFDYTERNVHTWLKITMLDLAIQEHDDALHVIGPDLLAQRRVEYEYDTPHPRLQRSENRESMQAAKQVAIRQGKQIVYQGNTEVAVEESTKQAILEYVGKVDWERGYGHWRTTPAAVVAWLKVWQQWLAYVTDNRTTAAAILAATPRLDLREDRTLLEWANIDAGSKTAEGWAVFGPTRVPIAITRERFKVITDHLPIPWRDILDNFDRVPKPWREPWPLDVLAVLPEDFLLARFPTIDPTEILPDVADAAERLVKDLAFLPGMTAALAGEVGTIEALANADPVKLVAKGIPRSQANFLIREARSRVPKSQWSLADSGIAGVSGLGLESIGDVVRAGPAAIEALGLASAEATRVHGEARGKLEAVVMAPLASALAAAGQGEGNEKTVALNTFEHSAENIATTLSVSANAGRNLRTLGGRVGGGFGALGVSLAGNVRVRGWSR